MNVSVREKKIEALGRMSELGIHEVVIKLFEMGKICFCESGMFTLLRDEDLERIREFERQYNTLVFIVIRDTTSLGVLDSFLFVSDYPEEWEYDRRAFKNGEAVAYVYNHNTPYYSDMGSIGIKLTAIASLRRIW